jgi:hypothetical protein
MQLKKKNAFKGLKALLIDKNNETFIFTYHLPLKQGDQLVWQSNGLE